MLEMESFFLADKQIRDTRACRHLDNRGRCGKIHIFLATAWFIYDTERNHLSL